MADFIITSLQPWELKIGSLIKNTALEISKSHRVLYVNPPVDIATQIRSLINKKRWIKSKCNNPIRRINNNLWVLDSPFTIFSVGQLPHFLFTIFNRLNNKKIGNFILTQSHILGFKDCIHIIDNDLFRSQYLKEYLHPSFSIYYRRDYLTGFKYWKKNGPHAEEYITRKADIVLANSNYLAKQMLKWNNKAYSVNTGVDLILYDANKKFDKPKELKNITLPIVGYTGAILRTRLNSNLVYHIAKTLPYYYFVFVGPEDNYFENHPIHQLPNVCFTGHKQIEELPAYVQHFDVCINPQILNEITDGNYPMKIDEYLAMGKPIVATSTHTMRDVFTEYVHLATDEKTWIEELHKAIKERNDANLSSKRIAFAHTHTWKESVNEIYNIINVYKNLNSSKKI